MVLNISKPGADARKLTQSVLQVVAMLDLYQAELARILHLQCEDIGRLANGQSLLKPGSEAWELAIELVALYRLMYRRFDADGVSMRNWLRRRHPVFAQTPHLMLVDEDRLTVLIDSLQSSTEC